MACEQEVYSRPFESLESAETLCDIARPLIQAKARRLAVRPGFTRSDQPDIEQDAYLRLIERFADRAGVALPVLVVVKRVVDQSLANQVRNRLAQKRDARRTRSFGAESGSVEQVAEARATGDQRAGSAGSVMRDHCGLTDLAMDVDEAIEQLSTDQQELCRALGLDSVAELARRLHRPRSTLQDAVRRIRRKLQTAGLEDYLQ